VTASAPVSAWIRGRNPAPPPQLVARIDELVAGVAPQAAVADTLIDAAQAAMTRLLSQACLTRDSALDLLAVDALVTYAFEAAADDPEHFEARTQRALARISALAEPYQA
jgi:hypothetical protein